MLVLNIHTRRYVFVKMIETREKILEAIYESFLVNGFQATRPDKVVEKLGVTKGALYHYFDNKLLLGYAVVEEIISKYFLGAWQAIEKYEGHPIDFIHQQLQFLDAQCAEQMCITGCPLNNLIQEMSLLDEGFRIRLHRVVTGMVGYIQKALEKGQQNQQIKPETNAHQVALFIVATMEGAFGVAKVYKDKSIFRDVMQPLHFYLDTLRN
jgi:TetR/AcrR family transcriptional regulator, transcriptional repressor for nem operon